MSSRSVRTAPEPGHAQQVLPADAPSRRQRDNFRHRYAKRFPLIIVAGHAQPPYQGCDNDEESVGCVGQPVRETRQVVVPAQVFSEGSMRDIAKELQHIVKEAAGPISPGMGIKAQINAACDNLGYRRGHWRVRAAWYGEAGNWRARAVFDLIDRFHRIRTASGSRATFEADPPKRTLTTERR